MGYHKNIFSPCGGAEFSHAYSAEEFNCCKTPLKKAIENTNIDVDFIVSLIKAGAVEPGLMIKGFPILHWAIMRNDAELVRAVVEKRVALTESHHNKTAIELAAANRHWDIVEIIAKAKRTSPDDKACYGKALLEAIKYNQVNTVVALLAANTPLDYICPLSGYNLLGKAIECPPFCCNEAVITAWLRSGA